MIDLADLLGTIGVLQKYVGLTPDDQAVRLLGKFQKIAVDRLIEDKWARDARVLPLVDEHRTLYRNIHLLCLYQLSEFPNLVDCRDYNDRIQWLKLFDQGPEVVRCSDKLGLRDFVEARLGTGYLPQLLQVASRYDELDFAALPSRFVIKTNHDSGSVILVPSKDTIDHAANRQTIGASLARVYGWEKGEWAYSLIEPRVFAEAYLGSEQAERPADFKFHCVDGRVAWLQYIYDRGRGTKEAIVDTQGRVTPMHFDHNMQHSEAFEKPAAWDDLVRVAEVLAQGFKYVRVDLYAFDSRIVVGEMTFFPLMGCYRSADQKPLGQLLDFDRRSAKPPICGQKPGVRVAVSA
jgi:TupA-like ATPgrasp